MQTSLWQLTLFSIEMSVLSTVLILPIGLATAWCLARYKWRGKILVETIISLPLVVPPVASGLLLLKIFGRKGPVGSFFEKNFEIEILFTWKAVVLAMSVMSFPLLVRSVRTAFEEINPRFAQVAATLGAGPWRAFWTISLPLAWRGVLAGTLLAFARALGEFGATIMVAGNIPGETQTLALAIYQSVLTGQDERAYLLVGISTVLAFLALWIGEVLVNRRHQTP
jgi:molybdate transport system permease protein